MSKALIVMALTGLAFLGASQPASAQYYYGAGRPYGQISNYRYGYGVPSGYYNSYGGYPGYGGNGYGYGDTAGGYLSGASNVISSQGQYLVNTQQAYQLKEQTRGTIIDNRRKAFDEKLYEQANTPTFNEVRVQDQQNELRRALTQPPEGEIWSGKTLNDLLANAQQMHARGIPGPDVPISSRTLKEINLTVKQQGNVGLLKDTAKLRWPLAMETLPPKAETKELRDQIDALLPEGKKQAMTGQVDAGVLDVLDKSIDKLRGLLKDQVSNVSFSDYTAAKRYLGELDQAVTVLKQPDASKYVSGAYAAKGHTMQELVNYMSENGLRFAAATAGEESAYSGLYQGFLRYTLGNNAMTTTSPIPSLR